MLEVQIGSITLCGCRSILPEERDVALMALSRIKVLLENRGRETFILDFC
jgi:hypothetical protein